VIHLVIKGTVEEARQAGYDRAVYLNEFVSVLDGHYTSANTENFCEYAVVKWFCETLGTQAPHPVGTLLHYTFRP